MWPDINFQGFSLKGQQSAKEQTKLEERFPEEDLLEASQCFLLPQLEIFFTLEFFG